MTTRTYMGVEIIDTWPTACQPPGATVDRSDPEHYEAYMGSEPPYTRLVGRTLDEIRSAIRAFLSGQEAQ